MKRSVVFLWIVKTLHHLDIKGIEIMDCSWMQLTVANHIFNSCCGWMHAMFFHLFSCNLLHAILSLPCTTRLNVRLGGGLLVCWILTATHMLPN